MTAFRIREAAQLLGVSDDTLRRWIDAGHISSTTDHGGPSIIQGVDLARYLTQGTPAPDDPLDRESSARNRLVGVVTDVLSDTVMSQVELRCGTHRVVSLMSTEAVRELGLEVGALATAVVKATTVIVETPATGRGSSKP